MRKINKVVVMLFLGVCLMCGCTGESKNNITLDKEDQELLEELGDDITTVEKEDFSETVTAFGEDSVGQVFQLIGTYHTTEGEEGGSFLFDSKEEVSIALRYLEIELTEGEEYRITGIVAENEHGDHSHMVFDVLTVESYAAK